MMAVCAASFGTASLVDADPFPHLRGVTVFHNSNLSREKREAITQALRAPQGLFALPSTELPKRSNPVLKSTL
jgi:hypothetical protein